MATTRGCVQQLKVTPELGVAWIYIGPRPSDTELFILELDSAAGETEAALTAGMLHLISECLAERRELEIEHGVSSSAVRTVVVYPA